MSAIEEKLKALPFKRSQAHVHGDDQAWIDKLRKELAEQIDEQRISCKHDVNKKRNTNFDKNFGGCMNTTNLDKIKELTEALKESIKWLECTEDGTDEQIRRIFGEETVDMLNRHRNIVKKTSEASVFPWEEKQKMQPKVIYETDPRLDPNFESSEGET